MRRLNRSQIRVRHPARHKSIKLLIGNTVSLTPIGLPTADISLTDKSQELMRSHPSVSQGIPRDLELKSQHPLGESLCSLCLHSFHGLLMGSGMDVTRIKPHPHTNEVIRQFSGYSLVGLCVRRQSPVRSSRQPSIE